jgi:hypothetical protein
MFRIRQSVLTHQAFDTSHLALGCYTARHLALNAPALGKTGKRIFIRWQLYANTEYLVPCAQRTNAEHAVLKFRCEAASAVAKRQIPAFIIRVIRGFNPR